jgi:hypothetical protein
MLDPWIIEEIKRREQRNEERPVLELPIHRPEYRERNESQTPTKKEEETPRGVAIIDYGVACWYSP